MADKQIGIGVDASQTRQGFDRIRKSAEDLAKDIIRSSRAYSSSSKEVTKDIEEQIRAIEKRNKLDKEFREGRVQSQVQSGQLTESQGKAQVSQIRQDFGQDRMQTQLLRELIETVKQTSKEEIREDRSAVEKRIAKSRKVDELAPEGDPFENLKETLQKGELGNVGQEEVEQRQKFSASQRGLSVAQSVMQSSNEYEAVTRGGLDIADKLLPTGGIIGAIATMTLGYGLRALQAAAPYTEATARNRGVFGQGGYANLTGFGMNLAESNRRYMEMGRASGFGSLARTRESAILERGAGLDMGMIGQLERYSRGGGMSAYDQTGTMIEALRKAGAIDDNNLALLPEYMQSLISINREQLDTLGEVDAGVNVKMLAGISELDESFKNPEVLQQVVGKLRGGLTQASSPQMEALQYSILSRSAPGASLFELQKMREAPFFSEGGEMNTYLPDMLGTLQKMSGGSRDRFFMNIMQTFGTSATIAEKIGSGFIDSPGRIEEILKSELDPSAAGLRGRAGSGVSSIERSTAKFSAHFERTGAKMVDGINDLISEIEKLRKDYETSGSITETLLKGLGVSEGTIGTIKGASEKVESASDGVVNLARNIKGMVGDAYEWVTNTK